MSVASEDRGKIADHSHTCKYKDRINMMGENLDKMIMGLYGPLDKPERGFVHETRSTLKETRDDVKSLKGINQKLIWLLVSAIAMAVLKTVVGL